MEKRIMLIGEMGNGKSATGNSLIGMIFFKTGSSLSSVTKRYCRYQGPSEHLPMDQDLVIVDTPGFFSIDSSFKYRALEIQRYIIENPLKPPHAFLLVFSLARDAVMHNRDTINMMHILFGEMVFEHCVVVFTHADAIKTDEEFERYWQTDDVLREVVGKCGGRVTRIENRFNNVDDRIGILIVEIDNLLKRGKSTYQYPDITLHKTFLENLQDADDKTVALAQVAIELDKFLARTKTMKMLKYTGVLLGIGLFAAGGTKLTTLIASKGADLVKDKIGETATAAAKQFVDQNLQTISQQIAQQVEIKAKRNQGGCVVM